MKDPKNRDNLYSVELSGGGVIVINGDEDCVNICGIKSCFLHSCKMKDMTLKTNCNDKVLRLPDHHLGAFITPRKSQFIFWDGLIITLTVHQPQIQLIVHYFYRMPNNSIYYTYCCLH